MIYDAEQTQLADALARVEAGDTSAAVVFHQVLDKVMVRLAKWAEKDLFDCCAVMEDIGDHEGEEQLVARFYDKLSEEMQPNLAMYGRRLEEVVQWLERLHDARRRAGADAP